MDKKIKSVISKEKSALKETKGLLKMDRKHDKVVEKAKKVLKHKKVGTAYHHKMKKK